MEKHTNDPSDPTLLERLRLHKRAYADPRVQPDLRNPDGAEAADIIEGLQQRLAECQDALGFYAARETWTARGHPQIDADTAPILKDRGERARSALAHETHQEGQPCNG